MTLFIDGVESSHHHLTEPTVLVFEYMQYIQAVMRAQMSGPFTLGRPRVLHLGAAGCSMARAIHAEWPSSHQVAIEMDERLAAYVRDWFDLPRSPALRIRVQDALDAVTTAPASRYEVIVRDAFSQFTIPAHLTTTAYVSHVARVLSPGGIYLANCADHPPLTLTRREVATAREHFAHVGIITEPAILRGRRYGNIIIAASDRPFKGALHRILRTLPSPARLLVGAEITNFIAGHTPIEKLGEAPHGLS